MDLNGDGFDDVISGQYAPGVVNVWFGAEEGLGAKAELPEAIYAGEGADDARRDMKYWMSTANFIDWDGDGDLDMVVGDVKGGIRLAINEGSSTEPAFAARTPLKVGDADMKSAGKSDPLPVDWDGDGLLDIVAGSEAGDVLFFRRLEDGGFAPAVSALNGNARPDLSYRAVRQILEDEGIDLGYRTRVETADWNNDGLLDLLVGNCRTGEEGTTGFVRVYLRLPAAPADA